MGFLEKAGKFALTAGKIAWEGTQRKVATINRYKERFESLSDEELLRKLKSSYSSQDERLACEMLLKERGYGK